MDVELSGIQTLYAAAACLVVFLLSVIAVGVFKR